MPKLILPQVPSTEPGPVFAWREAVTISTYGLPAPDRNPMFLERRVYQGSSGRVYPLPFYDRVEETPKPQSWDAIHIENQYLRLMILPQLGGRIHVALDKTNGYDFIYRQDVIKPALVGLAGPWISGGIEFNWPQHHRPGTYMPCDAHIESHPDGSKTVWLSAHDPMTRMKGMHGVCLHPDKSYIELKVRLYNRTELTQTFLWWANVATRVHEKYQSFFPPDVYYVADHAKRAMSRFPLCDDHYYGVNYGERARRAGFSPHDIPQGSEDMRAKARTPTDSSKSLPAQFVPPPGMYAPNDLSWYANIPVPTSYMCMGTSEDFFGGYDHAAQAGIVHFASHHISPGKKQWTWGNHEFGYAWDRNLTDADENGVFHPYIELMAGVFTDNQPDFSYLAPGETRTFSQYWYPIREIGPAQANRDAAVSLHVAGGTVRAGVCVTAQHGRAKVALLCRGETMQEWKVDLSPSSPFVQELDLTQLCHAEVLRSIWPSSESQPDPSEYLRMTVAESEFTLVVHDRNRNELIRYQPKKNALGEVPPPATEIPPPDQIESIDELYLSGVHLEQYRHATRQPQVYWKEALRRDPLDSRCNNALGRWHLRRGEFEQAETCFRRAIERLTHRNPNPADGEAFYNLGLTLRHLDRDDEAYAAFYKATWNAAWRGPAHFALAQIDSARERWSDASEHLDCVLRRDAEHLQARHLKAIVLSQLGTYNDAGKLVRQTLKIDPLDWSAQLGLGEKIACDTQVRLDLALDYARAGLWKLAAELLESATPEPQSGTAPLVAYYLAYFYERGGIKEQARAYRERAAAESPDYCFPARLEEIKILKHAADANPLNARSPYYLGNLYYDRQRYHDAIAAWEQSVARDPKFATVWRNLGIAYFNVLNDPARARDAYAKAVACDPDDARLLYEQDQLRKRVGDLPRDRLATLEKHPKLVERRDDLTIELCALLNQTGQHDRGLELLSTRRFQPWEGGEGLALGQYVRTHLALGRIALKAKDASLARKHFDAALHTPENLGEAKHLLANQSDIHYWLGVACDALGDESSARRHWSIAASATGDFQEMSLRAYSEMSYYSALSLVRLGRDSEAKQIQTGLREYAESLLKTAAKIDYFATSLPTMLLFNDDLNLRQSIQAKVLLAQVHLASGDRAAAEGLLDEVLRIDPNHQLAFDLIAEMGTP